MLSGVCKETLFQDLTAGLLLRPQLVQRIPVHSDQMIFSFVTSFQVEERCVEPPRKKRQANTVIGGFGGDDHQGQQERSAAPQRRQLLEQRREPDRRSRIEC